MTCTEAVLSRFIIDDESLEVVWPMKRRRIRRADIEDVHLTDRHGLRRELGWGFRIGAGGLGGAFGWLWTQRRGPVQMYVSRSRDLVSIAMGGARSWLITPERPEGFQTRAG
ncbi:PH domain-containing protein [Thiohalocapsa marina]|uniref:PH domain-containing protein n=1 Tax=Thiohalocapsa marina TaxID=424902 RepID=UPI0036D9D7BB